MTISERGAKKKLRRELPGAPSAAGEENIADSMHPADKLLLNRALRLD
jgi:hypothetical protein